MINMDAIVQAFESDPADGPFSFVYAGQDLHALREQWQIGCPASSHRAGVQVRTFTYAHQQTGLVVQAELSTYTDVPALEWVLRFSDPGDRDTPIIEDIRAVDSCFPGVAETVPSLNYLLSSFGSGKDFSPRWTSLWPGKQVHLSTKGGRSASHEECTGEGGVMPIFDLQLDQGTLLCAVGWSGQWAADLWCQDQHLFLQAGMEQTHLKLRPGETIRSPRILLFWHDAEPEAARNAYRRFILKHHTPLVNGQVPQCPIAACGWSVFNCGNDVDEQNQIDYVDSIVECDAGLEAYWLDAGWYEGIGDWGRDVGNWTPKKKNFPSGLDPVAEHVKQLGLGFVLWFEPERVCPGTWLYENHPEWLIMPSAEVAARRAKLTGSDQVEALLDLGRAEARSWLVNHVSGMIENLGITVFRQDFNIPPLDYWRAADEPDRQGITEIRHIEGLYAVWDELHRRHPELLIDVCASGGRRLDLEACSRAVPLWRTDYFFEPEGLQSQMLGISRYLPIHSTGFQNLDAYHARSSFASGLVYMGHPKAQCFDRAQFRARLDEFRQIRPLMSGDFYALTSHSTASDVWCGYQFHRPDLKCGTALLFRRAQSPHPSGRFKLHGLQPQSTYQVRWQDTGETVAVTGSELLSAGLKVKLEPAASEILFYHQLEDHTAS